MQEDQLSNKNSYPQEVKNEKIIFIYIKRKFRKNFDNEVSLVTDFLVRV